MRSRESTRRRCGAHADGETMWTMRERSPERVLGPYEEADDKFRVIRILDNGTKRSQTFKTLRKAEIYVEELRAQVVRDRHTTESVLDEYEKHLLAKGDRENSIGTTLAAVRTFFGGDEVPLALLSAKRCAKLYEELRTTPRERTKKPPSTDYHRNILSQTKTFLGWCVERGYVRGDSPLEGVKGIGRRRPRGLSLGKAGNELRVRQAREWYGMALFKAGRGDEGATAALMALLLGLRASEIISRRVGDLDEDAAPGDLLWIPCSKTPAGRRTLEVPEVLRELLVRAAANKTPERHLFEASRKHELELHKPHERGWVKAQIHRICDAAKVPRVTAHAMRGLLATIAADRGVAGHVIAATLGHESERTTMTAYAAPGSKASGVNRRGLGVLEGGLRTTENGAK